MFRTLICPCSKHVEQILSVINITSDIKLVSNSSTITMMHGPINIRFKAVKTLNLASDPLYKYCGRNERQEQST